MHNTPSKSPRIKYKEFFLHSCVFCIAKLAHEERKGNVTYVVVQHLKLDFAFDPKPALSLTGLVHRKEGELVYMDPPFTFLMHTATTERHLKSKTHTRTYRINISRSQLAITVRAKKVLIFVIRCIRSTSHHRTPHIAWDCSVCVCVCVCVNIRYKNRLIPTLTGIWWQEFTKKIRARSILWRH
jgi:hypothetical protein